MIRFRIAELTERVLRLMGRMPPPVQAAALPWRRNGKSIEVLLITSRQRGRWILPKGWPEAGEPLYQAAEREAYEEAGIRGRIAQQALGSLLFGKTRRSGAERRCQMFVFPLEVEQIEREWPEMSERARWWLSPEEAAKLIKEPALARLVRGFHGNLPESRPA